MKKIILLMSLVASTCVIASLTAADAVQNKNTKDEDIVTTINALMDNVSRTAETLDAKKALSVLTDDKDAVFFFCSKPYNRQELEKKLAKIYGNLSSMKINMNKPSVKVLAPDAAVWIATGTSSSVSKSGEKYEELLTETWIWKKIDGKWKVIHYNESATTPDPAPEKTGK